MALQAEQRNYARLAAARRRGTAESAAGQAGAQIGGRIGQTAGEAGGRVAGRELGQRAGRAVDQRAELALRQNQERRTQDQDKTVGDRLRAEAAKRLTQAALVYSGVGAPLAKVGGKIAGKIGGSKTGRHVFYAGVVWIGIQMIFFLSLLFIPLLLMCSVDQALPAGGGFWGGLAKGFVSGATGFGAVKGFVCQ